MSGQPEKRRNNSRRIAELLFGETPIVPFSAPLIHGLIILRIVIHGIAENFPVYPVPYRLANLRRYGKFHIGYPHTDKLLISKWKFYVCIAKDVLAKTLNVLRVGVASVDYSVKIVLHGYPPVFSLLSYIHGRLRPAVSKTLFSQTADRPYR